MFDPTYIPDRPSWDLPPHSTSSREFVPWGSDPPEYNATPLNPLLKEERLRMLEREFGTTKARSSDFLDESGKPLIGTVDVEGNLVTQGPKKRFALRMV